jgi:hypothetical protein
VPAHHYLSIRSLRISEEAALQRISYVYVLGTIGDKAVAAGCFQALRLDRNHFDEAAIPLSMRLALRSFLFLASPVLLVAGHLFRHDVSACYVSEDLVGYQAFMVQDKLTNAALEHVRADAVLVKDAAPAFVPYYQNFKPAYSSIRNDISMELALPESWLSINDYEKALKHKYAQRFRKLKQKSATLIVTELHPEEAEAQKETIYSLYQQVSQRQIVRLGSLSPDYLPLLMRAYPGLLRLWMVKEEDKPVAFLSAWMKDVDFDMFYIGLDYARNEALQLYFNLLYYTVELAITHRKSKLILGRTALDAKARLGCSPHYLSTFLLIRNRWARQLVAAMQKEAANEGGEWENRHPFKGLSNA